MEIILKNVSVLLIKLPINSKIVCLHSLKKQVIFQIMMTIQYTCIYTFVYTCIRSTFLYVFM